MLSRTFCADSTRGNEGGVNAPGLGESLGRFGVGFLDVGVSVFAGHAGGRHYERRLL